MLNVMLKAVLVATLDIGGQHSHSLLVVVVAGINGSGAVLSPSKIDASMPLQVSY